MTHQLPVLPYSKSALIPYISKETIEFHYEKHHKNYVNNLNKLILGTKFEKLSLEEIIMNSSNSIFNNASQVWNHNFYWNSLSPNNKNLTYEPLLSAIKNRWKTFDLFKLEFTNIAINHFGSGWVWFIKKSDDTLDIISTNNANSPMIYKKNIKPLLTIDVWEHSYYIDFRNEKSKFVNTFWNIVNWNFAIQNFN